MCHLFQELYFKREDTKCHISCRQYLFTVCAEPTIFTTFLASSEFGLPYYWSLVMFCNLVVLKKLFCLCSQRPTPPLAMAVEEDEPEKSCGPGGFWEALTPCNGCRNLGFSSLSQVHTRTHAHTHTHAHAHTHAHTHTCTQSTCFSLLELDDSPLNYIEISNC